jgi:hypothetical protein
MEMEAAKKEHERQLKEKDDINEALRLKMNDMAEEFAEMLQVDRRCQCCRRRRWLSRWPVCGTPPGNTQEDGREDRDHRVKVGG